MRQDPPRAYEETIIPDALGYHMQMLPFDIYGIEWAEVEDIVI